MKLHELGDTLLLRHTLTGFAILFLLAACAAPPTQTTQPGPPTSQPRPATSQPEPATARPEATRQLCQGTVDTDYHGFQLTEPGTQAELLWQANFVPWWVRPSPDGRVLAVSDGGSSIYELKPDGTLGIAFTCPEAQIETFAAASDGALWFATRDGGRLYRVAPDGAISIVAQHGNRNLEAGPDGSVYAMENGLDRIDPDGRVQHISDAVGGRKFAIGPNGEIVALTGGKVVRVSDSGESTEIASGYGPEPWLTFGPDGLLYVTHWSGVDVIDLESGTVTALPWLENSNISESGAFAPDGRLLLYHPNTNVYAIDLAAQTIEVYHDVISNSWAMAVNPGDAVYIAFGNNQPEGETTIYRIVDQQTLEPVASVPYGLERGMAFDAQGMGYLAVGDSRAGGAIFRFDPAGGSAELYYQTNCYPASVEVHPQTGQIWWVDCNDYASVGEDGIRTAIAGVPGGENATLAITPAGEFYSIVFFHRDNPGDSYVHRLYRLDESSAAWEEVADLTQSDPGITLSTLTACADGRVYTVESLDASNVPANHSSYNAVRRLEPDGTLTLIGFDFAFDGTAADCDAQTGQIVFTSGAGVFAVTPP